MFFRFRRAQCDPPSASQLVEARDRADLAAKYDSLALRERATPGESNAWIVDHSEPGFRLTIWVVSGWSVRVVEREALARIVAASRAATNRPLFRDRTFDVAIERMLHRGDTTEVLVTTRNAYMFADSAGRYGERGKDVRRLIVERRFETWTRAGGALRLRRADVDGAEVWMGDRILNRDGV